MELWVLGFQEEALLEIHSNTMGLKKLKY